MSPTDHGDGRRKRWLALLLSILVHGAIVGAIGWSWWTLRAPVRAPQQLAIEATVVVERTARATPAPAPAPAPVEPPPEPAPQPLAAQRAADQARLEHEQKVAAEAA